MITGLRVLCRDRPRRSRSFELFLEHPVPGASTEVSLGGILRKRLASLLCPRFRSAKWTWEIFSSRSRSSRVGGSPFPVNLQPPFLAVRRLVRDEKLGSGTPSLIALEHPANDRDEPRRETGGKGREVRSESTCARREVFHPHREKGRRRTRFAILSCQVSPSIHACSFSLVLRNTDNKSHAS